MKSELVTKFKLEDEKTIESLRNFIDSKLVKSAGDYDYFNEVKTYKAIWLVSRLGRIVDSKMELLGILFSDEGQETVAEEEYYPVGEIARWKPELVATDYIQQLQGAHERKVRQLEFVCKK